MSGIAEETGVTTVVISPWVYIYITVGMSVLVYVGVYG